MNILITGAGGFIGGHLAKRLHDEGHSVYATDIKLPEHWSISDICTQFILGDLRDPVFVSTLFDKGYDEVYTLAADMGGAGYIFTGFNDADIMHNSALINLNMAYECSKNRVGRVFYSSSACMYPAYNQEDPNNPLCTEASAYPAAPDSEYGWEKLFSERLYQAFSRNYQLQVRIARFHNIFGPQGTWNGGKEKAPAAICRKVAEIIPFERNPNDRTLYRRTPDSIDIWGDGKQTRSFLYIDECVEGIIRLMHSDCTDVVNIGSSEMVTINELAQMAIDISGKNLTINHIEGPQGVRGRNSDNNLIQYKLGWQPTTPLRDGMEKLYKWIQEQVQKAL